MAGRPPLRRFGAALLGVCCALLGACATVVGFPDRVLDDTGGLSDGGVLDGVAGDGANDGGGPTFTGPARASLSAAAVDFGLVSCGAPAPAAKVVTITNMGGEPLTWTAALAPTPDFAIRGPSAGVVGSGAFGSVTIESTAVPALSGAGETAQGVLTITTNEANGSSTSLPVKRTAAGGRLTVVPLTAAFGDTPANVAAQDIPIALTNTGNQEIVVGFAVLTPPIGGFTRSWAGAPAAVTVPPGGSVPGLVAGFAPTTLGSFTSTSAVNVTGPLCGTNPAELTFTGNGTSSTASVQPGSLDFGYVDCGTTAVAKKIKLINSGAATFQWNATFASGAQYTLSATSGDVAAGSFVEVTVTPKAVPQTSSIAPNLYGDTLTVTTNAPGDINPHPIDVLMTARGAILAQSAGSIDFGSILVSSPATSTFTVSNAGNSSATVSYGVSPAVFSVSPQGQVVGAGSSFGATARFAPTAQQPYSGGAQMTVASGTVLCAPLKPAIPLSGKGALGAQITPSSLDFGLVACGSTAAPKTVTLTNTSAAGFTWTASRASSYYAISPTSGSVAAGGSTTITVTPQAIPTASSTAADLYADTLTIQTMPPLESPYVASIHMTAQGAILSFNPTTLSFGYVAKNGWRTKYYSVVNDGNLAVPITLTSSGSAFSINSTSATVNAGSSGWLTASFHPPSTGTLTGSVSVSTSAKRCAPLPPAMTLTGDGY